MNVGSPEEYWRSEKSPAGTTQPSPVRKRWVRVEYEPESLQGRQKSGFLDSRPRSLGMKNCIWGKGNFVT